MSLAMLICWVFRVAADWPVLHDPSRSREDWVQDWGQVAGIYNRAAHAKEMREALERWGDHVQAITK